MRVPTRALCLVGAFALLAMLATPAVASNVLDQTTNAFQQASQQFGAQMQSLGMRLLFILATIQISVNGINWLTKQGDFESLAGSLVNFVITLGLWYGFIHMSQQWLPSIINGFHFAGQKGSGLPQLSPSAIIDQGIDLMGVVKQSFIKATGSTTAFGALMSNFQPALESLAIELLLFLSFAVLAFQMVMTTISGFFWLAVVPLLLGFGGMKFTRDLATTALKGGVTIGGKILVTYLLAGVAAKLAPMIGTEMGGMTIDNMQPMWECAAVALIFALLSWQLPKIAGDVINGSASLSAGEGMQSIAMTGAGAAGMALGGVTAAQAMGSALGHAGGATAAAGTGLMKAIGAGINSGMDLGKSGTALASHALSQVGGHGLGLMTGQVGDKLGGAKANFAQAVDNSFGGRVASSIDATRGGTVSGVPAPASTAAPSAASSGTPVAQPANGDAGSATGFQSAPSVDSTPAAPSSSSAPAAASSGSTSTTSPSGSAPVPGDASTASISGDTARSAKPPTPGMLSGVHQRMKDLQGYIPQDGHTVGLNANINAHGHE
ncbi:P-type conjugative transfer protein TrbL [Burkholderia multivorans]|uniref:P-type conjugative transfer protein TrbL n=1 Tax=Burkholderia multivorans TaxID=87883 RepID=UPI000CFED63C|nr:P-type conjugative transfer protein TrbL [Burkholderia multivorans]PRG46664.1 P-type conjugative transfer protein TrbL [Burkholderia multivorans]